MQRAQNFPAQSLQPDFDPFAEQLHLSRVHPQLVPMRRQGIGYVIHSSAASWQKLPDERGFAGFGVKRGLRMLLDVLRGLRALQETYLSSGVPFAHGEVAPIHFRIDPRGVCRLVPLTMRHSAGWGAPLPDAALGYLSPERLIGEQVGAQSDVFSIGVLLWEALACRRLFDERNAEAIIDRMMNDEIEPPDVPAHFSWAAPLGSHLNSALQVNQERRVVVCTELAEAIARVALDRLPAHAELAAFFEGSGRSAFPVSSPLATPAVRDTNVGFTNALSQSATFAKPTLRGAHLGPLEPVKQRAVPFRFTTMRMSAVQLRQNGLFGSGDFDVSEGSKIMDHSPAARPSTTHREEVTPQSVAQPSPVVEARRSSPPPPSAAARQLLPPPPGAASRHLPSPPRLARLPALPAPRVEPNVGAAPESLAPPSSEQPGSKERLRTSSLPPPLPTGRGPSALPLPAPLPPRRPPPLPSFQTLDTADFLLAEPTSPRPAILAASEPPAKNLHRSRRNAWGWSALAIALIGTIAALVFSGGSAASSSLPRAVRAAPRITVPDSPTELPNAGARPVASGTVSTESGANAVQREVAPARAPGVVPEQPVPAPSGSAAGRYPRSVTPARPGIARLRDYGI